MNERIHDAVTTDITKNNNGVGLDNFTANDKVNCRTCAESSICRMINKLSAGNIHITVKV
ncbi:hypothetical protein SDC9_159203 [bioreactor metagenome]|uniref:Uncharacterized protein n=1 Tax=bioreactor metagenome TaxID=1076179 RepID=A0A645FHE2_9ZZZZ